ncbi:hypothetical protein HY045_04035, partial [Candidatus Woesebacteria bacterium]|nr:hypothetical protein [Candidatus Woesebacteria bacterium]
MKNLLAQVPTNLGAPLKGIGPLGLENKNPSDAPLVFVNFLTGVIGVMSIIAIIWMLIKFIIGAIGIISAGGDKGKLEAARNNITGAIIGFVVVISAVFLADLIGYLLGIPFILDLQVLLARI